MCIASATDPLDIIKLIHSGTVAIDGQAYSNDDLTTILYSRNPQITYRTRYLIPKIFTILLAAETSPEIIGLMQPSINAVKNFIVDIYEIYKSVNDNNIFPIAKLVEIPIPNDARSAVCNQFIIRNGDTDEYLGPGGLFSKTNQPAVANHYITYLLRVIIKEKYPNVLQINNFGRKCEMLARKYTMIVDDDFYKALREGLEIPLYKK